MGIYEHLDIYTYIWVYRNTLGIWACVLSSGYEYGYIYISDIYILRVYVSYTYIYFYQIYIFKKKISISDIYILRVYGPTRKICILYIHILACPEDIYLIYVPNVFLMCS